MLCKRKSSSSIYTHICSGDSLVGHPESEERRVDDSAEAKR